MIQSLFQILLLLVDMVKNRDEHGSRAGSDRSRILTFFGRSNRIGFGLGINVGPDRNRIVMSRNCQLKYVVS